MKKTVLIQHSTGEIHVGISDKVKDLYTKAESIVMEQRLINPNIIIRKTIQL